MDRTTRGLRWHSPAVFALIGLCFLLPFATVSCEESDAETTFTGAQLATWSVPEGGLVGGTEISTQIEGAASALAALTLGAAALGLAIGALRLPRGEGYCAGAGLVLMTVLLVKAVNSLATTLHAGYGLALLLFLWAAAVHARRAWHAARAGRVSTSTATKSGA